MSTRHETRRITVPASAVAFALGMHAESGWTELERKVVGTADDGGNLIRLLLKRALPDPVGREVTR